MQKQAADMIQKVHVTGFYRYGSTGCEDTSGVKDMDG